MDRVVILRLLLNNPDSFKELLDAIFNSLFEIYKIKKLSFTSYVLTDSIAQREYSLDQVFNRFLAKNVLPNLTLVYQEHEASLEKLKKNEDEIFASIFKGAFEFIDNEGEDIEDSQY